MKVIVGSRDLWPTPGIASAVLAIMVSTDEPFCVRSNKAGTLTSSVEEMVVRIGERIGRRVTVMAPLGGADRATVFTRDNRMVAASSGVYAFFAPGQEMVGGTGHVVAVAIKTGTSVEAYCLDEHGNVVELGSDDGEWREEIHANHHR